MRSDFIHVLARILVFPIAAIAVSCEPADKDQDEPVDEQPRLVLDSPTVNVDAAGGVWTVAYSVTDPMEGGSVTAFCPDEYRWISGLDDTEAGIVSFTAARNEDAVERKAYITLTYTAGNFSTSEMVEIVQEANIYDFTMNAGDAACEYYGDIFWPGAGPHSYYFMLSDIGWDYANAKVYNFDIYAPAPDDVNAPRLIPGTYTLGLPGEMEPMTFSPEYSHYCVWNSAGNGYESDITFTSGTLEITEEGDGYYCKAVITDADGNVHSVVYSGSVDMYNYYEETPDYYSSLDSDVTLDLSEATVSAFYYADYYGFGTYNWYLDITCPGFVGDAFIIELQSPYDDFAGGLPAGDYPVSPSGDAWTTLQGYYDVTNGTDTWSWYYRYASDPEDGIYVEQFAPLYGGNVKVSYNGDGTCTLDINCTDDNLDSPHRISGSWTGTVAYTDHTDFDAQNKVSRRR